MTTFQTAHKKAYEGISGSFLKRIIHNSYDSFIGIRQAMANQIRTEEVYDEKTEQEISQLKAVSVNLRNLFDEFAKNSPGLSFSQALMHKSLSYSDYQMFLINILGAITYAEDFRPYEKGFDPRFAVDIIASCFDDVQAAKTEIADTLVDLQNLLVSGLFNEEDDMNAFYKAINLKALESLALG